METEMDKLTITKQMSENCKIIQCKSFTRLGGLCHCCVTINEEWSDEDIHRLKELAESTKVVRNPIMNPLEPTGFKQSENVTSPIIKFNSQQQLQRCIEEWQKILFLEHWVIKGSLVEGKILDDDDNELLGQNVMEIVNNQALIRISDIPEEDCTSYIQKSCAELVVVHELLHCKYDWVEKEVKDITAVYYDTLEHQLIDQMAKSLIMTKYNLDFSWFRNF